MARNSLQRMFHVEHPGTNRLALKPESNREGQKKKLDNDFRVFVMARAGHRCERCRKESGAPMPRAHYAGRDPVVVLQVAHFKSRRIEHTRWEPDNAALLCKGCHFLWAHSEPDEFRDWWTARIGENRMARLNLIWRTLRSRGKPDLELMRLYIASLVAGGVS